MKNPDAFIARLIRFAFGLIRKEPEEKTVQELTRFIKFGIVGVSNTLLAYIVHVIVLTILKPYHWRWDYVAGNLWSFFISVTWSFYWNNKYVFAKEKGQKRNIWLALFKTYLSYAFTGIILSNILSFILIEKLGISKYLAPLLKLLITVPLNFLIVKGWAFKSKSSPKYRTEKQDENESR